MKKLFLIILILLFTVPCFAASKYIRTGAAGTNDGSSWTNAYPSFAGTTWTRGNTYYLAGGAYNENVTIPTEESGASWIIIKKANAADNSGEGDWDAAYATTQAVINGALIVYYGYTEINGVTGSGTSGHGIRVYTATEPAVGSTVYFSGTTTSPRHLYHVEVEGPGFGTIVSGSNGVYWNSLNAGSKGFHVSYCWLYHNTTNGICTGNTVGTSYTDYGMLIENNVFSEMGSDVPAVHGQGMQIAYHASTAYTIIRNNVFRNVSGTGNIVFLEGTGTTSVQSRIYNNVFYYTDMVNYPNASPGVIYSQYEGGNMEMDSIFIYNNTFYGVGSVTQTAAKAQIILETPTTNVEVKNNLWVNCNFTTGHHNVTTLSNNDYYNNTGAGVPTGETGQQTETADPFTSAASADFTLKGTASGAIGHGADLSSIFTTDITGATRATWDIGAYWSGSEGATQYTLTVSKAGTGTGTVASSPSGISCGATCAYAWDENTEITLTATPTGSDVFAGWSGTGGCTGTSTCVLTMTAAKAATATFNTAGAATPSMSGCTISGGSVR